MRKSYIVSLFLTTLFGPVGLFYTTLAGAIAMTLVSVGVASVTSGLGLLVVWPVSMLAGIGTVHSHNRKMALEERRHRELVAAAAGRGERP